MSEFLCWIPEYGYSEQSGATKVDNIPEMKGAALIKEVAEKFIEDYEEYDEHKVVCLGESEPYVRVKDLQTLIEYEVQVMGELVPTYYAKRVAVINGGEKA